MTYKTSMKYLPCGCTASLAEDAGYTPGGYFKVRRDATVIIQCGVAATLESGMKGDYYPASLDKAWLEHFKELHND